MKVLWLCNIMLPMIAKARGMEASNKEGWLTGLSEQILKNKSHNHIELTICFPTMERMENGIFKGETEGIFYYGFYEDVNNAEKYDRGLEERLERILKEAEPDVIHIFGTEYPHTLAMTKVCPDKGRILVGLQGICGECAKAYMADLPRNVQKRFLLRDFLKWDNVSIQQKKFAKRGVYEREALQNVKHVAGRTAWDKQVLKEINATATYHVLQETLRAPFYEKRWSFDTCQKYRIFASQGNYPLKGFHYILEAMPELLKSYPDTELCVAGDNITRYGSLVEKIKISSYGKYCRDLIRKNHLEDHVRFLGKLSAEKMREAYLQSHLFVSASSLENSPNSVGEAMLLGMPVISSDVGGVSSMMTHEKEGLLFTAGDKEGMVQTIRRLFEDSDFAIRLGKRASERAKVTHDGEQNYRKLLEIYDLICDSV